MAAFRLLIISCFFSFSVLGTEIDSLKGLYESEVDDSLKARLCLKIGDQFENIEVTESIKWGQRAIKHAERTKDDRFIVKVLNYTSTFYYKKGEYSKQIKLCLQAFRMAEENEFFQMQGRLASNIASAYIVIEDSSQALKWLTQSIELKEKYGSKEDLALSISNLGSYYFDIDEINKATAAFEKALVIQRETKNQESIALNLANIADCYMVLEKFDKSIPLLNEALAIRRDSDDQYGVAKIMLDFSYMFDRMKNYNKALVYGDSALALSQSMSYSEMEHDATYLLAGIYKKSGNLSMAYEYQVRAYDLWQELYQEESANSLNELRTQYETEKLIKDGEIKDLNLDKNQAQINNQRLIIGAAIGGLAILAILVYYLNKWNKDKREKNSLLSEQKRLVETKNREILDSIEYAKRIQAAILPSQGEVDDCFEQKFILYKPKDVVAGDFYWVEKVNDKVLFAAADCTGHGVPGAMVSVVCNNGLNRSVREHGLTEPGEILDRTRDIVLEEFEKSVDEVSDGMDIALCSIEGKTLKYAGAHNPLWIVRQGELIEIKANKQPIGKFDNAVNYTTHELELETNDAIYLFSDGFADQFGGVNDKKYKSTNFKKFLLSIESQSMQDQLQSIDTEFEAWKGKGEQLDDVCVIGVRV